MILVKNWKFPLCLFLGKISYEITFDNHLVRKQAFQYYKIIDFTQLPYWIILKGLTNDFGKKNGKVLFVCFWTECALK